MESAPACNSAETDPDNCAASAGKVNVVVEVKLFTGINICCYLIMSKDVALPLFVTVFAQKTSMLALCADMVLQKWVAEVIVVCHLCFLKASVYKLPLLSTCECVCVWKTTLFC